MLGKKSPGARRVRDREPLIQEVEAINALKGDMV